MELEIFEDERGSGGIRRPSARRFGISRDRQVFPMTGILAAPDFPQALALCWTKTSAQARIRRVRMTRCGRTERI
jgi:hypothetical protein